MTTPEPQPRDIAVEQESAEVEAQLERESRDGVQADPGTDDPAELSQGRS
jgi:hypothetical protein